MPKVKGKKKAKAKKIQAGNNIFDSIASKVADVAKGGVRFAKKNINTLKSIGVAPSQLARHIPGVGGLASGLLEQQGLGLIDQLHPIAYNKAVIKF